MRFACMGFGGEHLLLGAGQGLRQDEKIANSTSGDKNQQTTSQASVSDAFGFGCTWYFALSSIPLGIAWHQRIPH